MTESKKKLQAESLPKHGLTVHHNNESIGSPKDTKQENLHLVTHLTKNKQFIII